MRSSASLLLLMLAGCGGQVSAAERRDAPAPPPEVARSEGPTGTAGTGEERYDRVGYATWYGDLETNRTTAGGAAFDPDAIAAAHRTLPLGSIAEVTALDSGRTILVRIADRGPNDPRYEIDLTRGAAALLGVAAGATPVRVRAVVATAADASALARGQAASPRLDAPPALLAALRRELPPPQVTRTPASSQRATRSPPTRPAALPRTEVTSEEGRYAVQVAAFSTEPRAAALARSLGGSVQPAGALFRVRLGPFRDLAAAQRARDGAARRGYADAQIIPTS